MLSRALTFVCLLGAGVCLLAVTAGYHAAERTTTAESAAIPNPFVLEITGSNKSWSAKYPDASGGKGAAKVVPATREIHLPLDTKIILLLKSTDYVYTFAIPQQELKEIAVPGLEFRMTLLPTQARQLELVGEGLCGDPHTEVPGRLIFDPPSHFLKWQRSQP